MLISTFNAIARYYEELPAELQKGCCQPALPLMGNLIVGEALMMQQSGARRCALATVLLLLSSCGLIDFCINNATMARGEMYASSRERRRTGEA